MVDATTATELCSTDDGSSRIPAAIDEWTARNVSSSVCSTTSIHVPTTSATAIHAANTLKHVSTATAISTNVSRTRATTASATANVPATHGILRRTIFFRRQQLDDRIDHRRSN